MPFYLGQRNIEKYIKNSTITILPKPRSTSFLSPKGEKIKIQKKIAGWQYFFGSGAKSYVGQETKYRGI